MFFVSALAVGLLASCSNDEVVQPTSEGNGNVAENGLVPVKLAMKQPMNVVTRGMGMGTIGGLEGDEANNVWRGETLYFNMYMKTNANDEAVLEHSAWMNLQDGVDEATPVENFANEPIQVFSNTERGDSAFIECEGKYYPQDKSRHEFFAYHIDDAATNQIESRPVINDEVDELGQPVLRKSVDFQIDGSQDLMVGQALNDWSESTYSQNSARAGVVPSITMQHLLTRFTFEVVAGDETAEGLEVRKISLLSHDTGRMLIAWHPDAAPIDDLQKIIWDEEAEPVELDLKEREVIEGEPQYLQPLKEMTPVTLGWNAELDVPADTIPVGEALMVEPGEPEYTVYVVTKQMMDDGTENIYRSEGKIRISAGDARPGTSYKVTVKLYGLAKIELSTTLTAWAEGEDITVDTAE